MHPSYDRHSGETVAQPIDNCTDNTGIQLGICINTDNDSLTVLAQQQKQIKSSGQPSSGGGSLTLDDQRAQKTADAKADPASGSYKDRCKELFIGKAAERVRLFLMMPLSFGASCLLILRVDPIRTRGVYPPRATSSTWPLPSSTLTGPGCISDRSGFPTRISSFPRLSRSPAPPRPTSSTCWDATSRSRSPPRTTNGTGVMALPTWSPPPQGQCGPRAWI